MTKSLSDLFNAEHPIRKAALEELTDYLDNTGRFSVLVLGERGTGKSRWIKQIVNVLKNENRSWFNNFKEASCASFNEETAESELFGYGKGAFTGQLEKGKKGLFLEADKGVLFLDEIHHLSDRVRAKLLTALQTEGEGKQKGKFMIRRLGESELHYVEVRPVFGSNRSLNKLKHETLLPDFFDRIGQLVVTLPSLSETRDSIETEFKKVFNAMKFSESVELKKIECPTSGDFQEWLQNQNFPGNFRDLERIAILWSVYWRKYRGDEKQILKSVKEKFNSVNLESISGIENSFSINKPFSTIENHIKKKYAEFVSSTSEFKSAKQHQKISNTGKTKKTIENWRKGHFSQDDSVSLKE